MLFEELRSAVEAAPRHQLDVVLKGVWAAFGAGSLDEEQAAQLSALADARRQAGRAASSLPLLAGIVAQVAPQADVAAIVIPSLPPDRNRGRVGSRPRTDDSRTRTRRWVLAGYLPPAVGDTFTQGEAAVLSVVAAEVARRKSCTLSITEIAGRAGVGDSTVKRAIKQARLLGLLKVEERRVAWDRNLPNRVTIVCKGWTAWLRFRTRADKPPQGGVQTATGTNTGVILKGLNRNRAQLPAKLKRSKSPDERVAAA